MSNESAKVCSMNILVPEIDLYSDKVSKDAHSIYVQRREIAPVVYLKKHDLYAPPRYKKDIEVHHKKILLVSSRGNLPVSRMKEILVGSPIYSDPLERDQEPSVGCSTFDRHDEKICSRGKLYVR